MTGVSRRRAVPVFSDARPVNAALPDLVIVRVARRADRRHRPARRRVGVPRPRTGYRRVVPRDQARPWRLARPPRGLRHDRAPVELVHGRLAGGREVGGADRPEAGALAGRARERRRRGGHHALLPVTARHPRGLRHRPQLRRRQDAPPLAVRAAGLPEQILGARRAVHSSLEDRRRYLSVAPRRLLAQQEGAQIVVQAIVVQRTALIRRDGVYVTVATLVGSDCTQLLSQSESK